MTDFLTSSNLEGIAGIKHGFFTRLGGISTGSFDSLNCGGVHVDDPASVKENRRRVATAMGVEEQALLSLYQIHSSQVVTVTKAWPFEERPQADAMVTQKKGLALGILTADCVPVLFADPKTQIIGAAHAGWRGALGGALEATIKAMEALGAERSDIVAAIGPCIWQDSYEVGPDFPKAFLQEDSANGKFFIPSARSDHHMFDLPGYVLNKLMKSGLTNVTPSPADTCADERRFFSYRRSSLRGEPEMGRLISVIASL